VLQAHAARKLPILVGGTGLYLRTLLDGIAPVPPIDPTIRETVRASPVDENWAELRRQDPASAEDLSRSDRARVARALEVLLSTGRSLRHWQAERTGGIGEQVEVRPLVLLPPRPWLYRRCDQRFAAMLDGGAIEEVQRLLARRLDPALPAMRAIGVRQVQAVLAGELNRGQALAAGSQATRNYAKRQYTWFGHQPPPEWPRFPDPLDTAGVSERALALLGAAV
jgi:tRNA dimethylallyltransferase